MIANKIILPFVLLFLSMNPVYNQSETILIEAENFEEYYDIGLELIHSATDTGCSGGNMLVGLDLPDEWVEYALEIETAGSYSTSITHRGILGQEFHLKLILTPESLGMPQTIDFNFIGSGTS